MYYLFTYLCIIFLGDNENNEEMSVLLNSAIFLSNLFQSTSDTPVLIRKLKTLSDTTLDNMILLGTENCTKNMELKKLINFTSNGLKIGKIKTFVNKQIHYNKL